MAKKAAAEQAAVLWYSVRSGGADLGAGAGAAIFLLGGFPLGQAEPERLPGAQHGVAKLGRAGVLGQNAGQLGGGTGIVDGIVHSQGSSLWFAGVVFAYGDIIPVLYKNARFDFALN